MIEKIIKDIITTFVIALVFFALIGVFSQYLIAVSGY